MYYKLIKSLPKHEIGEIIFLNDDTDFYEWVESPNYLLPKEIVIDCEDFFEPLNLNWRKGDALFYISSCGEIIEQRFNPKTHIKYIIAKNSFKTKKDAKWFLKKCDEILNDEVIITNKETILILLDVIKNQQDNNNAIDILNKIIK